MNRPDESIYLRHILDAIERIGRFLQGIDQTAFDNNDLVQSAVIYQIQIVGEAARYLSPDLRRRYPAIPWQDIVGMRSKLVHDYFGINREAIWLTATRDIPTLVKDIQQILAELENL